MKKRSLSFVMFFLLAGACYYLLFDKFNAVKLALSNASDDPEDPLFYLIGDVDSEGPFVAAKGSSIAKNLENLGYHNKEYDLAHLNLNSTVKDGDILEIKKIKQKKNSGQTEKININEASAEELIQLPGIGSETAAEIIAYRKKNKFKRLVELKKIKGIGEKKYSKLSKLVSL